MICFIFPHLARFQISLCFLSFLLLASLQDADARNRLIWDRYEASYFSDEAMMPFLAWCRTPRPVCDCASAGVSSRSPLLPTAADPAPLSTGKSSSPGAVRAAVVESPPPSPHAALCPFYIPPLGVANSGGVPASDIGLCTRPCFSASQSPHSGANMSLSFQVAVDASDARARGGVFDNAASLPACVFSSQQVPMLPPTPTPSSPLLLSDGSRMPPHELRSATSNRTLLSRPRSASDPRARVLSPFSQVVANA